MAFEDLKDGKLYLRPRSRNLPRERSRHPKTFNIVSAAIRYATWSHEGETLKYDKERLYIRHPVSVSKCMRTNDEKATALLHDVIENRVKEILGSNPDKDEEDLVIGALLDEVMNYFAACGVQAEQLRPEIDILTKRVAGKKDPYRLVILGQEIESRKRNLMRIGGQSTKKLTNSSNKIDQLMVEIENQKRVSSKEDIMWEFLKDRDYEEYIDALIQDARDRKSLIAVKVKLADLIDNMREDRNPRGTDITYKDRCRLARYKRAKERIETEFPNLELLNPNDRFGVKAARGKLTRRAARASRNGFQRRRDAARFHAPRR